MRSIILLASAQVQSNSFSRLMDRGDDIAVFAMIEVEFKFGA